jgi:hypothetical protein
MTRLGRRSNGRDSIEPNAVFATNTIRSQPIDLMAYPSSIKTFGLGMGRRSPSGGHDRYIGHEGCTLINFLEDRSGNVGRSWNSTCVAVYGGLDGNRFIDPNCRCGGLEGRQDEPSVCAVWEVRLPRIEDGLLISQMDSFRPTPTIYGCTLVAQTNGATQKGRAVSR